MGKILEITNENMGNILENNKRQLCCLIYSTNAQVTYPLLSDNIVPVELCKTRLKNDYFTL